MKRSVFIIAIFLFICGLVPAPAAAQSVRYDAPATSTPGATVEVCASPANGVPCSNFVTTYDFNGNACSNNAQDTPQPNGGCQPGTDNQGRAGFWVATAGNYAYTVCVPASGGGKSCTGPFAASIGGSGAGTLFAGACDGVTDDTAKLNSQLTALSTAGGGTLVFPANKTCLFTSQINIPNNGDSWTDGAGTISSQNPLRLTCSGPGADFELMSTGATVSQIQGSCVLNLQFNAAVAKILFLGMGLAEVDHLSLIDSSTDCANFIFDSNTRINFHDNAVIGTTKSVTSGPYSCNDVLILGGQGTTPGMVAGTSPFQGYGTVIENNFFNQIRRAMLCQIYCNDVKVQNNKVWSQGGSSTTGPFEINCTASCVASGNNLFTGNLMEVVHYAYGINIGAGSLANNFVNNNCYDALEFSTICVRAASSTTVNSVFGGYANGQANIGASDVWTTFIGIDPVWSRANKYVIRTDDFNLLDRGGHLRTSSTAAQTVTDTSPQCTMVSGTCTYTFITAWSVGSHCTGTWNGTGTLTGILKIVSGTTTAVATSSVGTDTAVINMVCAGAPN
jgi:hypothetical protein